MGLHLLNQSAQRGDASLPGSVETPSVTVSDLMAGSYLTPSITSSMSLTAGEAVSIFQYFSMWYFSISLNLCDENYGITC